VTRPLRDHRQQQDAQLAIIEQPSAMPAATMMVVTTFVVMLAAMARMIIAVVMVAVATKSVSKSHIHSNPCLNFMVEI
jgi:hypothetical protein